MALDLKGAKLTWLGHATFLIESAGKNILIDPWVMGNPLCPEDWKQLRGKKVDLMLVTHGHFDHIGDAVEIARQHQPMVIGIPELCHWLGKKGVQNLSEMNKGGTQRLKDFALDVTMVHADHSCGIKDGDEMVYGGEACGYVLSFRSGLKLYHSGDTNVFGDMKIIHDLYAPELALLPIGDHYTMGPREVAYACTLLKPKQLIPMHHSTFPVLVGRPEHLRANMRGSDVEIIEMQPGETR